MCTFRIITVYIQIQINRLYTDAGLVSGFSQDFIFYFVYLLTHKYTKTLPYPYIIYIVHNI